MNDVEKKSPELFRINIKPGCSSDYMGSFKYCVENRFLGMGWGVGNLKKPVTWQNYWEAAKKDEDDQHNQAVYLYENVRSNDLIWTREPGKLGKYYLARVTGGWEYNFSDKAQELDIFNVVPCAIVPVNELARVPGIVQASFRGWTMRRINHAPTLEYSKSLWNDLNNDKNIADYKIKKTLDHDIWYFLTAEQIEDIVFIYLQSIGWWIIPNSRTPSKVAYEYMAVHPDTEKIAKIQVKSPGGEKLDPCNYKQDSKEEEPIFLFHAAGDYGSDIPNVICISPREIEDFLVRKKSVMLPTIRYWINKTLGQEQAEK